MTQDERRIDFTFPLRPNFTVRLVLPPDLTDEEVVRLHRFLLALVRPEPDDDKYDLDRGD